MSDARHKESEFAAPVAVMSWASVVAEVDAHDHGRRQARSLEAE
jgi:hypothetical protein